MTVRPQMLPGLASSPLLGVYVALHKLAQVHKCTAHFEGRNQPFMHTCHNH
jgi:hypothetical protein